MKTYISRAESLEHSVNIKFALKKVETKNKLHHLMHFVIVHGVPS